MRRVYLDYAATTPIDERVLETMLPYYRDNFGNPSSIHTFGQETRKAITEARQIVARELGAASEREIIFTGGGSESDNLAIKGAALAYQHKGKHLITSSVEHHAVYDTFKELDKQGFRVTYLPVDQEGLLLLDELQKALTEETILVSIIHGNNEVGTIQPLAEISGILKAQPGRILLHSDAVQTVGVLPIDVNTLGVDLLSLSAHKFYGPKGVGALYVRNGVKLAPLIHGGAQERKRRAGTENVPGIIGLAKAFELAGQNLEQERERLTELRDYLIEGVLQKIDHVQLNGHFRERLPGNVNFSFQFVEGESLLLNLDFKGIAASSGSACTSGSLEPSHVLLAMGIDVALAHGSIRFSLGKETTKAELDYLLEVLPEIVAKLRAISPLYKCDGGGCSQCTATK